MDGKSMNKSRRLLGKNHLQLVQLAVLCLAAVSLYTTAQGMSKYIFHNDAVAYAASTAIQGILLAMSMGLPGYLGGVWRNEWNVLLRLVVCAMIVVLTAVTMFCSSFFSYIYIAEVVHFDSWDTDSELLVQQTYRTELYRAYDYTHSYRLFLEEAMGQQILMLEEQADRISEEEQLDNLQIDWTAEREKYGDTSTTAGNYMAVAIETMEKAMGKDSAKAEREQAVQAVKNAQNNIDIRMENIRKRQDELDAEITASNSQTTALRNQIKNAVAGTDITSLQNSMNRFERRIESATEKMDELTDEYDELSEVELRLQFYEDSLGLNDDSNSIVIENKLLEMQKEFFQENPNEEKLFAAATSLFESLRKSAFSGENGNMSYTNLLIQMNQLLMNLKDYADSKELEGSLDGIIKSWNDKEDSAENTGNWKSDWRNRLEKLKAEIGSIPIYSAGQAGDRTEESALTNLQINTLLGYDRDASSRQLDDMIRLYIADHSALYQGLIYLQSPYRMLAVFSAILAATFDLSGFILGLVSQGRTKETAAYYGDGQIEEDYERNSKRNTDGNTAWSIVPTLNKYRILTGDYEKKDQIYNYQVFEDGLLDVWNVDDSVPYVMGIYLQDRAAESKGALAGTAEQRVLFKGQPGGPVDGVYLNCRLEFEEGSLYLVKKVDQAESRSFLANLDEYVPVHSYNPSRGESQTFPAEQLSGIKTDIETAVLALNAKGTRIAAIYVVE